MSFGAPDGGAGVDEGSCDRAVVGAWASPVFGQ